MLCDVRCVLIDGRGTRPTHDVACGGGRKGGRSGDGDMYLSSQTTAQERNEEQ